MGINGLTGFFAQREKNYKTTIRLQNVPVVIDGHGLMYFLYFGGPNPIVERAQNVPKSWTEQSTRKRGWEGCRAPTPNAHWFGGDLTAYAQNVRWFLEQLKQCEITPIILMDGPFEEKKKKTDDSRFNKSIKDNVTKERFPGKNYKPVFLKVCYLRVLVSSHLLMHQKLITFIFNHFRVSFKRSWRKRVFRVIKRLGKRIQTSPSSLIHSIATFSATIPTFLPTSAAKLFHLRV